MIEIKNLKKSYNKGKEIIKNINLKINDGEIFGFIGPNGAGKTTTIKMITGILKIDDGDVLIDNYSIQNNPIEAKKRFGYVPDNPEMFLRYKAIEYFNFMADMYEVTENERKKKIEELSELFGIKEVLNNKIESYSHGMKQKVFIIGAMLHNPNNLIIDEPMIGLDPISSFELKKLIKEFSQSGKTVFFSTHILEVAEKICDRVGIINNGKIVLEGRIEQIKNEFKNDNSLEEVFMEIMKNDK